MPLITKVVRDAFIARLQNASTGLNANLLSACSTHSIDAFSFDWSTLQFWEGWIDADMLEASTQLVYPVMAMWASGWNYDHSQKFVRFSGPVDMTISVWLSCLEADLITNAFELKLSALDDAMIQTFNTQAAATELQAAGALWNGDISRSASPVQMAAGESFRQQIQYRLICEVVQA